MIITFDFLIRLTALATFAYWIYYWKVTELEADIEKPKTRQSSDQFRWWILRIIEAVLVLQILGLSIFPIPNANIITQLIGLLLVIIGVSIGISARKTLGTNWAHAFEYQIKEKQTLVTTGVYKYVRHPIYSALLVAFLGGELVAGSYLTFAVPLIVIGAYFQAKREEKILTKHFGEAYKKYMKHTKRFIPFLV